jgi:hypothetical protein
MAAANRGEASSASSCQSDHLLDLLHGLRLYVEFGRGMERACPCVMSMFSRGSEGNAVIEPVELSNDRGIHGV